MYDAKISAMEKNLCKKLKSSAPVPLKIRYALRLGLRNIRVRYGQKYYRLVEKSFFWINGQYAYGLVNLKDRMSQKAINSFYRQFLFFPFFKLNLIEMPDQYIHAEVLLELYEKTGKKKYLPLIRQAANYLKNETEQNGTILRYGNGKNAYIDTLGMITEFCYHYDRLFNEQKLSQIAEDQMDFFLAATKADGNDFPYHAYDIASNGASHTGSNSWGRGIGWYLLGLGACVESHTSKYADDYKKAIFKLFSLQNAEGFLFEDMESRDRIDTSTTSMAALALYTGLKAGVFQGEEKDSCIIYLNKAVSALLSAITEDGKVLYCTGECAGANAYSQEYGDYYAQGYTLRLLTHLDKDGVL